jgi:Novel STAND NTPase 1
MSTNNENFLMQLKSKRPVYAVIFALGLLSYITTTIDYIEKAIKSGNEFIALVFIVFPIAAIGFGISFMPKSKRPNPPKRNYFSGFGKPDEKNVWPREKEENKIIRKIRELQGNPLIIVGNSGTGKSQLIRSVASKYNDSRSKSWKARIVERYSPLSKFQAKIYRELEKSFKQLNYDKFKNESKLEGVDENKHVLLVLDQFEQLLFENLQCKDGFRLEGVAEEEFKSPAEEWFMNFFDNLKVFENIRTIIIIRKEWYYDLRLLKKLIPRPSDAVNLDGITIKKEKDTIAKLEEEFGQQCGCNSRIAEGILKDLERNGTILPIEIQIVGLMLSNERQHNKKVIDIKFYNSMGGKEGILQECFKVYLGASPNRHVTAKVLFALSVETKLRIRLKLPEIAKITHLSISDVDEALTFLESKEVGIVKQDDQGYELAHDYIAEKFREFSGMELDPAERDNILFFYDEVLGNNNGEAGNELKMTSRDKSKRRTKDGKIKLAYSDYFGIFLIIFTMARLFAPLYGFNWDVFGLDPLTQYSFHLGGVFDMYYFPVFIAIGAWAIYIWIFHRRFLDFLPESGFEKTFSRFIVINSTLMVMICAIVPCLFFCTIAIGGVAVGIKLFRFGGMPQSPIPAKKFFKGTGIATLINVFIVFCFGLTLIYYVRTTALDEDLFKWFQALYMIGAVIMVYYMIVCIDKHIDVTATSTMTGLIDRGRVRNQLLQAKMDEIK